MPFANRTEAGRRLATMLEQFRGSDAIVLALPRGGVPVAAPIARALRLPLDVWVVRKLGEPGRPEYGIGAIAEEGPPLLSERARDVATASDIMDVVERERAEVRRRVVAYRGARGAPLVRGRTVIVVDDGVATGGTMQAAISSLRRHEPRAIVVAVPVASDEALDAIYADADDVVCLEPTDHLRAIGDWYDDFRQVRDGEVQATLAAHAASLLASSSHA